MILVSRLPPSMFFPDGVVDFVVSDFVCPVVVAFLYHLLAVEIS